jgi:hypothetical protein
MMHWPLARGARSRWGGAEGMVYLAHSRGQPSSSDWRVRSACVHCQMDARCSEARALAARISCDGVIGPGMRVPVPETVACASERRWNTGKADHHQAAHGGRAWC